MNRSGRNNSGVLPVPDGTGMKSTLASILTGLGETQSPQGEVFPKKVN